MAQEMARGFSVFEEALLAFEAQDLNIEWYKKGAAAVQNAICIMYVSCMMRKQELLAREHWIIFQVGRIELSNEPEPVPSMSGMSEIAACPLSPVAKDP